MNHVNAQEETPDPNSMLGYRMGKVGVLVLTNLRLLLLNKLGMFSKDFGVSVATNLEDITSVSLGSTLGTPKLVTLLRNGTRHHFSGKNVRPMLPVINEQIRKRIDELEKLAGKREVIGLTDFSALKDVMTKGGVILTTYKCPQCGASLPIPASGGVMTCQYCNTQIMPIDIFEKLKGLL